MSIKPRTQGVRRSMSRREVADLQYVASLSLGQLREFVEKSADLPAHAPVTVNDLVVSSKDAGTYTFRGITAEHTTPMEAADEQA